MSRAPLRISVADPLYKPADRQAFAHYQVQVIQTTPANLNDTFLYLPFLVRDVKVSELQKLPGILFTDWDQGINDTSDQPANVNVDNAMQQYMDALPQRYGASAFQLLAGFGETFRNHELFA
jgi:hypothetical protein